MVQLQTNQTTEKFSESTFNAGQELEVTFTSGYTSLTVPDIHETHPTLSIPGFMVQDGPSTLENANTVQIDYNVSLDKTLTWETMANELADCVEQLFDENEAIESITFHGDSMGIPISLRAVEVLQERIGTELPKVLLQCNRVCWMAEMRENATAALGNFVDSGELAQNYQNIALKNPVLQDDTSLEQLTGIYQGARESNISRSTIESFPGSIEVMPYELKDKDALHTLEAIQYLQQVRPDTKVAECFQI